MRKSNKALIIGGLGFIGKNLYLKLKQQNVNVEILSNVSIQDNDAFKNYLNPADLINGDILDKPFLNELLGGYDVIYCLAGISGASESITNPFKDIQVNLLGHINILEACKEKNPQAQLFFPSSRLVYGKPLSLPVNEKHQLSPESIYAIHKITAERYYQLYHHIHGLKTTIFRISNPYGPFQLFGDKKFGMLNWFIVKAFNSELIEVFGTGDQKRDYIYIDDLTDLLIQSIGKEVLFGKTYNIGYGKGISIIDMIKMIQKYVPETRYTYKEWPKIYKLIETGDYISDLSLIKKDLGWSPKISFEQGLKQTIEFYKYHHAK